MAKRKGPQKPAEVKTRLIQSLQNGATVSAACSAAKIHRDTYYSWYNEDADFQKKVDEAKLSQVTVVEDALFMRAKRGNVAAICVFLFNRAPDKWKNTQRIEGNIKHEIPITFVHYDASKHAQLPGGDAARS